MNMSDIKDKRRTVVFLLISVFFIAVDQITKIAVVRNIGYGDTVKVIDKFFYLDHVRNTGSAFSLFADKKWGLAFLTAVSVVMAVVILICLIKSSFRKEFDLLSVAFLLLFAGAAGNLVDRFRLKYVVDFLRFDFGSYTFPIFNVADICAVVGTGLIIFALIFKSKKFDSFLDSFMKKKEASNG